MGEFGYGSGRDGILGWGLGGEYWQELRVATINGCAVLFL